NDLTLLGRWIVGKSTWLRERRQSDQTVVSMFLQMQSIGYKPDGDVSNYLISSLCKVDQYEEAVQVLWSMSRAECIPDLENFGSVIGVLGDLKKTKYVEELIREMVSKTPKAISPKVTDRRSPRTPTSEKKRPGRVTELETQLANLQEELKKAKEQLNQSDSWKKRAHEDAEEAKK
ncbi:interactor of constitutive active ROPs 2, chloroplastic, partial [Tanacetum coccineum]